MGTDQTFQRINPWAAADMLHHAAKSMEFVESFRDRRSACLRVLAEAKEVGEHDPERAGSMVDGALIALIDDPLVEAAVDAVDVY